MYFSDGVQNWDLHLAGSSSFQTAASGRLQNSETGVKNHDKWKSSNIGATVVVFKALREISPWKNEKRTCSL